MRQAIALLFLFPALLFGAAGDVKWAAVESNGWVLQVCVETVGTEGSFQFTNANGENSVTLTLESPGFDPAGNVTHWPRTLFALRQLRFPYGTNEQTASNYVGDVTARGPDVVVRLVLSDYVWNLDSNLLINISANWYASNNAVNGLKVPNYSTAPSQKAIANWLVSNMEIVSGGSFELLMRGGSGHSIMGRSLAGVKFTAADQHSNTVTQWATAPVVLKDRGYANPVIAWQAFLPTTSLTQGDVITCNFVAYPWIGTNLLDTSDGAHARPTACYAPLTYLCDKAATYGRGVARVSNSGNDSTGQVVSYYTYDPANPPPAFANELAAVNALKTYHRALPAPALSRNDAGGGVIYHDAGTYTWINGTPSPSTMPACYLLLCPSPGVPASEVILTSKTSSTGISPYAWVDRMTVRFPAGGSGFSGHSYFKLSSCVLDGSNVNSFYFNTNLALIANTLYNCNKLPSSSAAPLYLNLVLGNTFNLTNVASPTITLNVYTFCGNISICPNHRVGLVTAPPGGKQDAADGAVICENILTGTNGSLLDVMQFTGDLSSVFGAFIENGVFETTSRRVSTMRIAGSGFVQDNVKNVIMNHVTQAGYLAEWCYDGYGAINLTRTYCKRQNCLFQRVTTLSDRAEENSTHNGIRTGNWPELFGVGNSGEAIVERVTFAPEGLGANSRFTSTPPGWVNDASFTGTATGNGNYRLKSDSIVIGLPKNIVTPFDLEGNARSLLDPPGAYGSAVPKKGAAFLGL